MIPEFFQVFMLGLILFFPVYLIYRKAGFNPAWAFLIFLPVFGLLMVFMHLALMLWPNARHSLERKP